MHTVVLGWFGGSTLWFLPLFWRVAKSALPGGSGLRGPGTIRLWLGFVCVLVASCTFEASLVGIDGVDRFGHALSGGFGHLLGRVGTPLVMLALFAASLPWLIGFRWARAVAWADAAFGLGLSGKRRARDADRRSRRASDDTSAVNAALPAATLAPRSLGRYARPTVWRPPASTRDAAASGAVRGNGAAAARQSVKQPAAFTPTEPTAAAGWLRGESDAAPRERVLSRDRAAGHAGHPADGSRAAAAGVSGAAATDASKAFAAARAAGGAAGSPATQTRAAPPQVKQANAAAPTRVTGTAAGGSSTRSTTRPRPATPSASSAQSPRASVTGTARQQPIASGGAPAPSRVPGYSRPASETPRVEPTSSVQETLRNIEENTARWTTLAGASLARRSHTETARPTSEAIADSVRTDPATVPDPTLDVTPVGPVEPIAGPLTGTSNTVTAAESLHHVADTNVPANPVPLADDDSVIMPAASAAATRKAEPAGPASNTESREPHATAMTHTMASESLPPLIQPAIDRPAATEATKAPPPELRSPVLPLFDEAPTLAEPESEARPQQRAAQSNTASDAASTLALQPPARADTDTDATLASWEVVGEAVTALRSGSSMLPRHVSSAAVPLDGYGTRHAPLLHIVSPIEATAAIPAPDSPAAGTSLPHAPTLSNVVRFPGTSAGQMAPHRVSPDDAPAHMAHIDPSSDDADNESSGAHLTPEPATAASAPAEATLAEATPAEATPAEATPAEPAAASAASAAPGPPRGFAANSFEFHAPAASHIELPSLDLLARASTDVEPVSDETLAETGQLIEQRLQEFKVPVTVVGASAGPVITRFEVEPALGVRGSQIVGLMKDLSRGLGLTSIRVVETIPGKTCMGLELPNARRQTIRLSEILEAGVYQNSPSR
ncbi:MAG TPA: DNA translocase FtsK, partial [Paraburkholderia sp.]